MATAGTWRKHPFVPGQRYKVLRDCSYLAHHASAGAVVEYVDAGYERYDSTSLFRFVDPLTALGPKELIWSLHDDEPDSKVSEYFQKAP